MAYQLWELDSRNCVAEFRSRREALEAVRGMTAQDGASAAVSLLLVCERRDGDLEKIASGADLAQLAVAEQGAAALNGEARSAEGAAVPQRVPAAPNG